jgi:predicted nucleic acid-binding protein
MVFLLDSNAFSDLMREHAQVEARIQALGPTDKVITCPIVRGEVLYGIERLPEGKRRAELGKKAESLFGRIPCEPIPEGAGNAYAKIKRTREKKGFTLDENDLWIAAMATATGATLVTRDSDFSSIDGLTTADWTAT